MLFFYHLFFFVFVFFQNKHFQKEISDIPSVSNSLDPDNVGPGMGPNCLLRQFADDTTVLPAKSDSDIMFCSKLSGT